MTFLHFLTDLLFPIRCLHCGKYGKEEKRPVCSPCLASIRVNQTLFCGSCRSRLGENKKTCHKSFPFLLGAAGDYGDPVLRDLIHGLKFGLVRGAAAPLGNLMSRYLESLNINLQNFVIVPIPLSARRERERGFNQSILMAEIIGEQLNIPVISDFLRRIKNSPPQSEALDREERRKNIKDCFAAPRTGEIAGRNILLVDDVATSGATLHEAAVLLKARGARKIIAVVAAKA